MIRAPWWLVLALLLTGCAAAPQERGTPPEAAAASAQARADQSASAASVALDDAARLDGVAAGAELAAKLDPTEARIRAAVEARVAAVSARAAADALARNARDSLIEASAAVERALKERKELDRAEADQRARDQAANDARRARWIAALATVAAVVLAVVAWRVGVPANLAIGTASGVAGAAWMLPAMLSLPPWTWAAMGAVVVAGVLLQVVQVAVLAYRRGHAVEALSESLDASEADPHDGLRDWQDAAKKRLKNALARLPGAAKLDAMRGDDRRWPQRTKSALPPGTKPYSGR